MVVGNKCNEKFSLYGCGCYFNTCPKVSQSPITCTSVDSSFSPHMRGIPEDQSIRLLLHNQIISSFGRMMNPRTSLMRWWRKIINFPSSKQTAGGLEDPRRKYHFRFPLLPVSVLYSCSTDWLQLNWLRVATLCLSDISLNILAVPPQNAFFPRWMSKNNKIGLPNPFIQILWSPS